MTNQPETARTGPPRRPDRREPLWLPRGSVRAAIALGVISVWALLETGALGTAGAGDSVRTMAIAVAAAYGLLRSREPRDGGGTSGASGGSA